MKKMDISRRLDSAIRQMDRRLRESGGGEDHQTALEAAREELNAVLDEAAYGRRPLSPSSGLGRSARRLNQAERQLDTLQQFNSLQEEIRWVDEEASQARKEMEDRLEARIVAVEARVTAFAAVSKETEVRLKELERKAELHESVTKRSRMSLDALAEKVSSVVAELHHRLVSDTNGINLDMGSSSLNNGLVRSGPRPSAEPRPTTTASRHSSSGVRSESMIRELLSRVEALESELDEERDRSIHTVEYSPSRNNGGGVPRSQISPNTRHRPSITTSGSNNRRLSAEDLGRPPHLSSSRQFQ